MSNAEIETRVENLEHELALLKQRVEQSAPQAAWWDKIAGTFKDDAAHEEAMSLGREYRLAQRTPDTDANGE